MIVIYSFSMQFLLQGFVQVIKLLKRIRYFTITFTESQNKDTQLILWFQEACRLLTAQTLYETCSRVHRSILHWEADALNREEIYIQAFMWVGRLIFY